MNSFDLKPDKRCPKCGIGIGFRDSLPTYLPAERLIVLGVLVPERLRWECRYCGYAVYTPTADARIDQRTGQVLHPDGYPVDEMGG